MIDLNQIKVFVYVVESGSFTGAAKRLGMPSTTVSRKVQQLEDALNTRLINRSTRKLSLTYSGDIYFQQCQTFLAGIEDANQSLLHMQQEPQGLLRITTPIDFADCYLQPVIISFMEKHPKINVEVVISDSLIDLIENNIDIAFRSGFLANSSLVARRLMSKMNVFCASETYLKQYGYPESPEDLAHHCCILDRHTDKPQVWQFNNGEKVVDVPVSGRFFADSIHLKIKAAIAGLGIAKLPEALARFHFAQGSLVQVLDDQIIDAGAMHIVYQSHKHLPQITRLFIDHVVEVLAE
ncbi:hypothetical protein RN22_10195 [Grimontia sp. AD028]|uniref:LysR family transcriptional regulator n=1 Tax=Grimontia sp. AD028 TaxID=1581149 RepID=UPI00061B4B47|nr:LysR family transcriptional regulator [Grimontia sp. AD028]KKD60547.1 hypothetical protein RN22_10195 [Grimontia sp. AD028]